MRKYFDEKLKGPAYQLVQNIRNAFIDKLYEATWMDESTKRVAIEKAKAIIAHIAFPNAMTNIMKLENHYKSLEFNGNEYFMNALRLRKFETDYAFSQLHEPIDKTDWLTHAMPTIVNAFYNVQENSIREYLLNSIFFLKGSLNQESVYG